MRSVLAAAAVVSLVSSSAVIAGKKQPEVTGLALQQIQARDFEAPKSVTFPAVMTVLQDAGYRIASAEKETGLITGTASTNSQMSWRLFGGIRLNFVLAKTRSSLYGMSSSDEEPMDDPAIYQGAFEKIEKEIFIRQSLNSPSAPAPIATTASPSAGPASAAQQPPVQTPGSSPK